MATIPPVPPTRSPYPPRAGHRLAPWIDGVAFYSRLQEALDAATVRVWGAISFLHRDFCFPDGRLLWDVFDQCAARGVDVRLLFWRNTAFFSAANIFQGDAADRAFLAARQTVWRARWDDSAPDAAHCHHQKLWLVDDHLAFVGGMTLGKTTLDTPAHRRPHSRHDIFLELEGPATADVAHNFAQRWQQARHLADTPPPWPPATATATAATATDGVSLPTVLPPPAGEARVQVARTLAPGRYRGVPQHPGARPLDPWLGGEDGILAQYEAALEGASRTIYLENQHPGEEGLLRRLHAALSRGVRVVLVVPGEPLGAIRHAARTRSPRYRATFALLAALGDHPRFTLAALASPTGEVYVHAKVCLVDGAWGTVGSANLVDISLQPDHTELNVGFWHPPTAQAMLRDLLQEHTGQAMPDGAEDDIAGLDRLAALARANAARRAQGAPLQGHAYALDPATYGTTTVGDRR